MPSVESRSSVYCLRRTSEATLRLQFLGVERLADEVVCAGLQTADLVLARVQSRDERDWYEPGLGRLFELRANLEAVDAGHLDIHQDQIGLQVTKRRERLGPGRDRYDVIAVALQQPHQKGAVNLFVVADENGSESRGSLEHQGSVPERRDVGRSGGRAPLDYCRQPAYCVGTGPHLRRYPCPHGLLRQFLRQGPDDRRLDRCDAPARRARAREPARRGGVAGASRSASCWPSPRRSRCCMASGDRPLGRAGRRRSAHSSAW